MVEILNLIEGNIALEGEILPVEKETAISKLATIPDEIIAEYSQGVENGIDFALDCRNFVLSRNPHQLSKLVNEKFDRQQFQ